MRDKIIKAIKAVQALGWTVKPKCGTVSFDNKTCCPLAAIIIEANETNTMFWVSRAADILKITPQEAWCFVSGFDEVQTSFYNQSSPELYLMGQEINQMLKDEHLVNNQNKDSIEPPEKY